MTRRTLATLVAAALLLVMVVVVAVMPVPYVTMSPGPTIDVLGRSGGSQIIEVSGHRTYPTSGDLRLVTVSVTNPTNRLGLPQVMWAWFDRTRAVYPRDAIYPPSQSTQEVERQSSVEMVSSQDTAVAAALTELGYHLQLRVEVLAVTDGSPADGKLRVRDRILKVDGAEIHGADQVSAALQRTEPGQVATMVVRRGSATRTVRIRTKAAPDDPKRAMVGVEIGTGYDFPFHVSVRLNEDIGGPSAGLMFSLGVYDTLTPGSLTGGSDIAGTGTIDEHGHVGPIGGIQQKIVAASRAGARIFFVPPGNCKSAEQADVSEGQIELVRAPTMHSAVQSLRAYDRDHSADLPSCG